MIKSAPKFIRPAFLAVFAPALVVRVWLVWRAVIAALCRVLVRAVVWIGRPAILPGSFT
jgi:hypothetical protein